MLGGEQYERRAVDRVDAGGEDFNAPGAGLSTLGFGRDRKLDTGPLRPSDPVPLHRQDLVGPTRQTCGGVQKLVGVCGDPEEPLFEIAHLHRSATAPAAAVDHLLVGQHGVAAGAPVDGRTPSIGQAPFEHPNEEPLVPLVVLGITGGELALPGVADTQPLELPLHVRDVVASRYLRMNPALDGGILGRQTESIPPKWVQHVVASHPLGACHHVADDVVAHVADMRVAGRIGEHLEAIEFRPRLVDGDLERA